MSLAHLFEQPVVVPKPTRVIRAPLDVEPAKKAQLVALTPTEAARRIRRNEASRAWWAANKDKVKRREKKAQNP
jgi:hypothetical protein